MAPMARSSGTVGALGTLASGASADEAPPSVLIKISLGYDGTEFSGWAAQPGRRTVEAVLSEAIGRVLRLPSPPRLLYRLGGVLPPDLRVFAAEPAPDGFDARFSALWRRYSYRLCDDPALADPLHRHRTVWYFRPLDLDAMNQAAATLLGEHDFAAYCRRREGATTVRTLQRLGWRRDGILVAEVVADAFCHNMVRALMGALVAVGEGRQQTDWPALVLAAGERDPGVRVMPPHGLCLEEVGYPAVSELAER